MRDAVAAEEILRFALFKEVARAEKAGRPTKRRKTKGSRAGSRVDSDESEEEEQASEEEEEEEAVVEDKRMPSPVKSGRAGSRYGTRSTATSTTGAPTLETETQMEEEDEEPVYAEEEDEDEAEALRESLMGSQTQTQTQSQSQTQPSTGMTTACVISSSLSHRRRTDLA